MECNDSQQHGLCGFECDTFLNGECPIADEIAELDCLTGDQAELLYDLYGIEDNGEWF